MSNFVRLNIDGQSHDIPSGVTATVELTAEEIGMIEGLYHAWIYEYSPDDNAKESALLKKLLNLVKDKHFRRWKAHPSYEVEWESGDGT